jgi:hypothetical protein
MLQNNAVDTNDMRPRKRGRTRLRTLSSIDGRSRGARRARALVETWSKMLGTDLSPHLSMLVTHAAASTVIAEDLKARALAGDQSITVEQVVKASNIMTRAIRALGLPERGRERGSLTLEALSRIK